MKPIKAFFFLSLFFSISVYAVEIELLQDTKFKDGLKLLSPVPGKKVVLKFLNNSNSNAMPKWLLAQWHSKLSLIDAPGIKLPNGGIKFSNKAKTVILGNGNSKYNDIVLGVDSRYEYGKKYRKSGDPWPHLLISQDNIKIIPFKNIDKVQFNLKVKLLKNKRYKRKNYNPNLHCAHFLLTLTVQNRNKKSDGYGEFIWFNIPIFDDRTPFPARFEAKDFASGKFIYSPDAKSISKRSVSVGKWVTFSGNIMPVLKTAITSAREKGFLKKSPDINDFALASYGLGWEVPGINDVLIQVRNMSLKISTKK